MIRHLLLDLDNTLYPASGAMDEGITNRMLAFVASWLKVSPEEAQRLRLEGLKDCGTTLEWLRTRHGLSDMGAFFEAVHPESEIDELTADPNLRPYLISLGLPMTLLTNAPMVHATRVLDFFDIRDLFAGIYDLTFHNGKGKPHPSSFLDTLKDSGFTVEETLFVDDLPKYCRGYRAVGGKAVLVDERNQYAEIARAEGFGRIASIYGLAELLTRDEYRRK
jgi:putative hydrolase of the HAD superfamily